MSEPAAPLLLREVEVDGRIVDVHVAEGAVRAVGPSRAGGSARVSVAEVVEVVEGGGAALLPGLHDHHVHLHAMAARSAGIDLDPLPSVGAVDDALRWAGGQAGPGTWVRASGYDEHRHGLLDRARLDALAPGVAVRVQHRTGLSWVLSSVALEAVGLLDPGTTRPPGVELDEQGEPTGWLHRLDTWVGERVPAQPVDLAAVGRRFAGYGITGVTDATHALGPDRWSSLHQAVLDGSFAPHVMLLGVDDATSVEGWAMLGPTKLLADESLGLDIDALTARVAASHRLGRPVAIHAVTRAECVVAVGALVAAGPQRGDRLEHGSVLPTDLDGWLRDGGVTVVVQPSLVTERGDHHLVAVDADDIPFLHRHASLLAAGIRVGVGSDAPVTSADPWRGIAAASTRTTRRGAALGPAEAVAPQTALGWYLADPLDPGGPPRRVEPGVAADLCLLDVPLESALTDLDAHHVRATWVAGTLVHG